MSIFVTLLAGSDVADAHFSGVSPRRPLLAAVLVCTTAPVPTLLLAGPAPLAMLISATLLSGIGPMTFNTLWETTLQQHVP
jgi:hypothetical protein